MYKTYISVLLCHIHVYSKEAQQELPRTLDSLRAAVNRAPYLTIPITSTNTTTTISTTPATGTGATIGDENGEGNVTDISTLHFDSIQGPDLPFDRYIPTTTN